MIKKVLFSALLVCTLLSYCFAAALDGKWKGAFGDGQFEITLDLKVQGNKLTGTITSPRGENPITDGKVTGNEFTFNRTFNENTIVYKGKLNGDKIDLTVNFQGNDMSATLTRVP
ncbi:hypothetical protein [Adhaeribacter aquaticus]|uniref:hypothetical protein n=1 Tax=Adhaeribacter aquaticus TaxID=299567 RepID=UPI0003F7C9F7|nr:hypothetical protein [Adhaeribacter aquaticus]